MSFWNITIDTLKEPPQGAFQGIGSNFWKIWYTCTRYECIISLHPNNANMITCFPSKVMMFYPQVNKTIELISRNFWWSQMSKFVKEFICICSTCAWAKAPHHQPNGLLQPLTLLKVHGYPSLWTSSHLPPMIQVFFIKSRLLWLISWQKWQILSWPSKIVACESILKFFIDDIHACTMACHIKLLSFIMDYNSSLLFEKGGLIFGVLNHFFLSQSSTNRYINFKCKLNMK